MNSSNNFGFTPIRRNNSQEMAIPEEEAENKFGFQPIKKVEPRKEKEGFVSSAVRKATGTMTRAFESAIGSAGEFSEIANSITQPLADYLVPLSKEKKEIKSNLPKIPTTKTLREFSKEKTKGYLEPRGEVEKSIHEGAELLGSLIGPFKFRKALGSAVASQMSKEGLKLLGASETAQEAGKLGTLLATSMINPNGVKKFWGELYNKRDALTPPKTLVNGSLLEKEAKDVIKEIRKGTIAPTEAKVLDQAEKIVSKVKNGKVDLNEMIATKRSLNEIAGDPEMFKRGQHLFPRLQQAVSQTLELHPNKEAVKLGKMADEAFGAFHQSQKLTRSIKKVIGDKPLKSVLLTAGFEALVGHPESMLPTVVGAAGISGAVKSYELMTRINANPTLRKYYLDLLINASKGNINSTQKTLRKLDEGLAKKEKTTVDKNRPYPQRSLQKMRSE